MFCISRQLQPSAVFRKEFEQTLPTSASSELCRYDAFVEWPPLHRSIVRELIWCKWTASSRFLEGHNCCHTRWALAACTQVVRDWKWCRTVQWALREKLDEWSNDIQYLLRSNWSSSISSDSNKVFQPSLPSYCPGLLEISVKARGVEPMICLKPRVLELILLPSSERYFFKREESSSPSSWLVKIEIWELTLELICA